jgi:protein associated with RNAse G/E
MTVDYRPITIKSFKHNGKLHRMWLENWLLPKEVLEPQHQEYVVTINDNTRIIEADGKEWISRIPGVSFFSPNKWYNIIALIEKNGIRYYCNIASPFYLDNQSLTYIDYDLDVVLQTNGQVNVLDEDEYARHKRIYHYSDLVEAKVLAGLEDVLGMIERKQTPFLDAAVLKYYQQWKQHDPKSKRG